MKTPAAFPFFSHRTQAQVIAAEKARVRPQTPREIQLAIDRAEVDFEIWLQEQRERGA